MLGRRPQQQRPPPRAAARCCSWLPLAAAGRRWPHAAAAGCRWLPLAAAGCRSAWQPAAHNSRCSITVARTSLYDLLGVATSAGTADIRAAYRQLAARHHPDINPSHAAQEKFQAINLAADVLTSDELRAQYDQRGLAALPGGQYKLLHDFIKRVRMQGVVVMQGERGADISTVLGLGFGEAVTGSAVTVTTGALGSCPDCKGSGINAAEQVAECAVCRGSGELLFTRWQQAGAPRMPQLGLCPSCRGGGRSALAHCSRCGGEGRVQLRRHVRICVPAGVVDGQVLRVRGQGHSGRFGGPPGDLLVKLQVYHLPDVTRRGDDLHSTLPLCLYEALLGCHADVITVRGSRSLQVPPGTQHGHVLCVRGAGVARPSVNGVEYGHHFFQVVLQVPSAQAASTAELQLLQQLSAVVQQQQQQDSVAGMLRQGPAQDAREQEQQQQSQDVQQQGQQAQEQPSQQQQAQEQQQRVAQRRRRRREAADGS